MVKLSSPSSPIEYKPIIETSTKNKSNTLADVLLPFMGNRSNVRDRRSSSSSSHSSVIETAASENDKHYLRRRLFVDYNDNERFDVWLVRKPTTITCEQLSAVRLQYPNLQQQLDDNGFPRRIQQIIKVRSDVDSHNEWQKGRRRRRLICDFDRDKRRRPQMIRIAGSSSSRKHLPVPASHIDGVVSITEADDHRSTTPLVFKEIQCLPTGPPPNVRLFQRTTPFGAIQNNDKSSTSMIVMRKKVKNEPTDD